MSRFLAAALAASTLLSSQALAKPIKVGMIHWIAYSPINVADVKGIWKAQGIDVQVLNFGSNQELNSALEHKKVDIAIDMMGSWVGMILDGVPLKILGETDWSNGGDKIIVKKDADAKNIKGQQIGVYLDKPSVTFFLNKYLESISLRMSDVKTVEVEPEAMASNFIAGKLKLIVNYDPQALRAEREGNGKVVATSASFPGCIPEGFVARTDVISEIPKEDLKMFFKGWVTAVKWAQNPKNWKEYASILNGKTFEGEKPYSEKDLKEMLASVSIHDAKRQLERNRSGGGLEKYLVELHKFLQAGQQLKKGYVPAEILDSKVLVETLGEK